MQPFLSMLYLTRMEAILLQVWERIEKELDRLEADGAITYRIFKVNLLG